MTSEKQLIAFLSDYPQKSFDKEELILPIGKQVTSLFYLHQGYVQQYSTSSKGREFVHNIYKPLSIFPLHLALNKENCLFYFRTLTAAKLTKVPVSDITQFLEKDPALLMYLVKHLALGLNQLIYRFEALVFGVAEQKVAAALCLLGQRFGEPLKKNQSAGHSSGSQPQLIQAFPITHQFLAHMTALTRETVSTEMSKLKKAKIIDYQQQAITILQPQQLKAMSLLADLPDLSND